MTRKPSSFSTRRNRPARPAPRGGRGARCCGSSRPRRPTRTARAAMSVIVPVMSGSTAGSMSRRSSDHSGVLKPRVVRCLRFRPHPTCRNVGMGRGFGLGCVAAARRRRVTRRRSRAPTTGAAAGSACAGHSWRSRARALRAQPLALARVVEQLADAVVEMLGREEVDQPSVDAVLDDLLHRRRGAGDDRAADRHRLQQAPAQHERIGQVGVDRAEPQQVQEPGVGNPADEVHAREVEVVAHLVEELLLPRAVRSVPRRS